MGMDSCMHGLVHNRGKKKTGKKKNPVILQTGASLNNPGEE